MNSNTFDRLSFLSLFLVVVLLPIFFLPFSGIPVEISKGLLLVVGLALSLFFWAVARFFDGKISLPKSVCLLAGAGVVLAFFLSALFAESPQVSFFGTMFDIGTFWFIFAGFLLMGMSSIVFRTPQKAKILLLGAILSALVVLVFQGARLFFPELLALGVLSLKTGNLLGSWNAFGLFAGFSALMSLLIIEFFATTKIEKLILQILIILSLVLIATVNFSLIWILLGICSLVIFVYKISLGFNKKDSEEETKPHFPMFSFITIMLSLLFFMSGSFIGSFLPNRLELSNTEVNPSFSATILVTKGVLSGDPILGIGPNRFEEAWSMHKPIEVNGSLFWDVSFGSGSGLLPTLVSTTGILGILSLLLFFILLIASGVKSIFASIKSGSNWEMMAFFVLSLYLFVSSFFYSTGAVIFLLALAFAGVFIGLSSSVRAKGEGEITLSFLNDHRKSFFGIMLLIIIIILSAMAAFKYVERFVSISYFRQALTATTIEAAEASIKKTLTLYTNDLYLRTYAEVYLVKLNSLIQNGATSSESDKAILQATLDQAINGAQSAVMYNPKNYLNLQALASVYQTVGSLGIPDAYSKATEAYKMASTLNPKNPRLLLAMASVSFADKKVAEAKEHANAALTLKPDYIDALVVLSQIAKNEGDNAGAIAYAERALALAPANEDLIKYVESLKNGSSVPLPTTSTAPASTATEVDTQ